MTGLKIEISAGTVGNSDGFLLNGCATLWIFVCPSKDIFGPLIENFRKYVIEKLKITDYYFIFY